MRGREKRDGNMLAPCCAKQLIMLAHDSETMTMQASYRQHQLSIPHNFALSMHAEDT